jgi:light-regulated signal transduction histidine kinase (bacteriophytochrome)
VDDHEANLQALAAILEGYGEHLVTARSGPEALLRLLEREFAVVLLDVQMPGMDGFETAEMIRARGRSHDTPIVFLTAFSQGDEHVLRGYALGAVDYVFKPIAPEILRSKVAVFVELVRRRRREAAMRAELARSNQELATFAEVVAHDLQAPLRGVQGHLDLLQKREGQRLEDAGRRLVTSAIAEAERMGAQIRDLLAYARVRSEPAETRLVDASESVKRALELLRAPIEDAKASITCGPLPVLVTDPGRLTQLFQNLLDNAVKFRRAEPPRVHVSAEREGDDWLFTVSDNGIGIDEKDRERVFGVFQRLHSRAEYPGTGIGLAICRKIVEGQGGRIRVEASPEGGSAFRFTLPAQGE